MFTGMEREYFEKFIESQFENVHSKLDNMTSLQKIANGRTGKLEEEVAKLKDFRSTSQGHWSGVSKTMTIIGSIIGGAIGIIAAYFFKG